MRYAIKKGALSPPLRATLVDANGEPIPLDAATAVVLVIRPSGGGEAVRRTCTILDPETAGRVEYQWVTADTQTAGLFNIEFEIAWGAATQTVPNDSYEELVVVADLG